MENHYSYLLEFKKKKKVFVFCLRKIPYWSKIQLSPFDLIISITTILSDNFLNKRKEIHCYVYHTS